MPKKHAHYFRKTKYLTSVDVYRVCDLFGVVDTSGAIHHAIKKLLLPGCRGAKSSLKDLQEARDSIQRKIDLVVEDELIKLVEEKPLHYSDRTNGVVRDVEIIKMHILAGTLYSVKLSDKSFRNIEKYLRGDLDD